MTDAVRNEGGRPIDESSRYRGAIWGQFVGDAAALGTHWIYELDDLREAFPQGIEGFEAPRPGHYHDGKRPGDLTHYGEAALLLLESVAGGGRFDARDFGRRLVSYFGSPAYDGYMDKATRGTLESARSFARQYAGQPFPFQHGAADDELATATRLAPVVVAHWKGPDFLETVEALTRVCQNSDRAVAYMKGEALILFELFRGHPLIEAARRTQRLLEELGGSHGEEVRAKLQAALASSGLGIVEGTLHFGQSCPLANSFPSAVHAICRHEGSFAATILEVLRAGGDNAGRAAMVGAWLGAAEGFEAIPPNWIVRLTAHDRIERAIDRLVAKVEERWSEDSLTQGGILLAEKSRRSKRVEDD